MIEAPGVIERLEGSLAWVRLTDVQGGCGRCHEPGGCGGVGVAHAFGRPNEVFRVPVDAAVRVGQAVVLVADDGAALAAAMVSYGLPTVLIMLCVALGTFWFGETGALMGLLIALLIAVFLMRFISTRLRWQGRLSVVMRTKGLCSRET